MEPLTLDEYLKLKEKVDDRPSFIREGQAWFNELYTYNSQLANSIRTTLADPYYNNEDLPRFFKKICNEDCLKHIENGH